MNKIIVVLVLMLGLVGSVYAEDLFSLHRFKIERQRTGFMDSNLTVITDTKTDAQYLLIDDSRGKAIIKLEEK